MSELAREETEDVSEPAHQIAAVAHLLARADTFVKLAQQQATLAQMLRRFADRQDSLSRLEQMEMEELAYQQRRVQDGLRKMLDSLPELLAQVPDEPQYAPFRADVETFIKAVTEAKIEDDLQQSQRAISALDGKTGLTLAQQAADKMDRLIAKCCSNLPGQAKQCLRFSPKIQQALGSTLEQILAAMGANPGNGQGGKDGYSMFNDDVALYGSNMELAGDQGGGRQESLSSARRGAEQVPGGARDVGVPQTGAPGRVRLQPDARFPLRYRDLVGEYFKSIAESQDDAGGKK